MFRPPLPPFVAGGYLVGGAARDWLLRRPPKDYDWLVPDPAAAAQQLSSCAFALDPARGYWRAVVGGVQHDFAPLPADLKGELLRRDYTVNALAVDAKGRVTDPAGGLGDLKKRRLRMLSATNLRADPLRLLRGVRLAHTLGFTLEAQTQSAISELARERLPLPAAERVSAELNQLLLCERAAYGVEQLQRLGLLALYLPELAAGAGVEQGGYHHLDVLQHQLEALHQLLSRFPEAPLDLRWATLLHDIGKPECKTVEQGRVHFYGHAEKGAQMAADLLKRLKQSRERQERVGALVRYHMLPLPQDEAQARRFALRRRALLPDLMWLMLADREASRGPLSTPQSRYAYALGFERVLHILEEAPPPAPLLRGQDVMALLGLAPGPEVGKWLRALAEAQALGKVQSREQAEAFVLQRAVPRNAPRP